MALAQRAPRLVSNNALLGAAAFVVGLVIVVAGNYNVGKHENGGTGAALVTSILCLVLAVGLFGYVVPRSNAGRRTAWTVGVLAVVSIIAFWSGVTPILAAATVALARREDAPPRGLVILQWGALAAAAVALVGTLAQANY